tara:strand:- start:331 stop:810 length:480 start_codon:yes stop_codon:yes gene_type:complete
MSPISLTPFTQKEIAKLKKPLFQIIKSNRMTNMSKIGQMLVDLGHSEKLTWYHNMRHILQHYSIAKVDGYYQYVDPEELEGEDYKICWRCEKNQKYSEFPLGRVYIKTRLKICKGCIREENMATGESYSELIGIYSYLQHRYKHSLDKWMYRRFWEKIA